jgi:hypothetical protein
VRNEEVRQRVKEDRNNVQIIKRRKTNWIGHMVHRNCIRNHVTEEQRKGRRIDMAQRPGRRCNQLLDDLKEKRG